MLFRLICICSLLACCFIVFEVKAQIGSYGGFNTSILTQKKEFVFSVAKNFQPNSYSYQPNSSELNSYDVQAAYAFHPNMAAHIGYHSYVKSPWRIDDSCETRNCEKEAISHSLNTSIGGFVKYDLRRPIFLPKKKRDYKYAHKNQLLVNFYVSYGKAVNTQTYYWGRFYPFSRLRFDNYHLQSSLSWLGNFMGGSFAVKYGLLDFNKITIIGGPRNNLQNFLNVLNPQTTFYYYGLHANVWVGIQQIKLVYSTFRQAFINKNLFSLDINNYAYAYKNTKQLALQFKF